MNLVEPILRRARERPDSPALVLGDTVVSYHRLAQTVRRWARRLARAGVEPGDRVGLLLMGTGPIVGATLAMAYLGAVAVVLPGKRSMDREIAKATGIKSLLHNRPDGAGLDDLDLRLIVSVSELEAGGEVAPRVQMVRAASDDLCRINFSSGTTGRPKLMPMTHGDVLLKVHLPSQLYPSGPGDRVMVALGMGTAFALHYWLRPLTLGGCIVEQAFKAEGILATVRKHRVNFLVTGTGMALQLAAALQGPSEAPRPEDLRLMVVSGAPLAPRPRAVLRDRLCGELHVNYGATEAGLIAVGPADLLDNDPGCTGRLMPWVEAQAVDDAGTPLPAGTTGLLRVRSPLVVQGYLDQPAGTDGRFRDGWFYSSDRGSVTPDGRVFLAGRADDVLNLGGEKIDSARVEALVVRDAAVDECAAVIMETLDGRPRLVVAAVASEKVDIAAIKQRCREELGRRWEPVVFVRTEVLPRNDAGKIERSLVVRQLGNVLLKRQVG